MQSDSNRSFLSTIKDQAQSTPLKHFNGNSSAVSSKTALKKKARKRKSRENNNVVIDLTPPKTANLNNSTYSDSDNDVEIIESVPDVIDLVDDEISKESDCKTLDITLATTTVRQTKRDEKISIDAVVMNDYVKLDILESKEKPSDDLRNDSSLPCSSKDLNLYIHDNTGGEQLNPPVYETPTVYDMVSDDSFCFDSTPTQLSQIPSKSFDLTLTRSSTLLSQISTDPLIVDISDDLTLMPSPKRKQGKSSLNSDDSVVFVSETIIEPRTNVTPAPNFISLNPEPVRDGKRQKAPCKSPRKKKRFSPLNITSPSCSKRMVIIDGSNVAFNHGLSKVFSVEGIAICLDYFIQRGHETKAVLPEMRRKKFKSSNQDLLEKLHDEKKITFTPCKNLDGRHVSSYDDRVILEFACQLDAVVVSNDNYRDIRNEKPEFSHLVMNRVIGYSFINDVIVIPSDPYGRNGPSLQEILTKREK